MDTIFSLKPKKSIKAVIDNSAMMRLKMQNALIQQELNRVKAANAALALAAQQREHEAKVALHAQQREHEAKLALEAHLQQQQREHEARLALEAHQREHEARVALEAHRQQQQQHQHQHQHHHQHQHQQQEAPVAPQIKKSKFGKLLSNMNKLN